MGGPSLFAQYEDEYCNKRTDIQRKINAIQSLGADLRRQRTSEADNDIRDAEGMIKRMDMEARSLPASHAQGLLAKVKEYKLSLAALKEQLQQAIAAPSSGDAARAELGLGVEYHTTTTGSQRERMLLATQRMEKTSERLANGKRMLAETETAGQATLAELQRQRQVIQHSAATLRGVQPDLKQSEKSLSSMQSWFGW